jgi:DNA-binding NtrC family response regulator
MSAQAAEPQPVRRVWIVEDEPEAAALAAELCLSSNADPLVFRTALPYLVALRASRAPDAVVLDWRLERELSAALFLATRHRYPSLPIVYWTGTVDALPATVLQDRCTRVVDKADGAAAFERAVAWALEAAAVTDERPTA